MISLLITYVIVVFVALSQIPSGNRLTAPFEGRAGEPNTLGGYLILMNSIKKVYVLLYDNFSDFEIVQTTLLLRDKFEIVYVGFHTTMNRSITKLNVMADILA